MRIIQKPSCVTGKREWQVLPDDDSNEFLQSIARSSYADMLHDTDRNKKFFAAIKMAVKYVRRNSESAFCLDIGTGSGLLSMMALSSGAEKCYALEAFAPMASCADNVFDVNGYRAKAELVVGRSTAYNDNRSKMFMDSNIVVAELLDTELIGEGLIDTYRHSIENLNASNPIYVPYSGQVFCQIIQSDLLWFAHKPTSADKGINDCRGAASFWDCHVDEVLKYDASFRVLSRPIPVFEFVFDKIEGLPHRRNVTLCINDYLIGNGVANAIILWWECRMIRDTFIEPTDTVPVISTAPVWVNDPNSAWRDHWMQGVYFPHNPIPTDNNELILIASHDNYSLWFDIVFTDSKFSFEMPSCSCGICGRISRSHLIYLNNATPSHQITALKSLSSSSKVLLLSDMSSLQQHLRSEVITVVLETLDVPENASQKLFKAAKSTHFVRESFDMESISTPLNFDVVIGDPWFEFSLLPFDNALHYFYTIHDLKTKNILSENVVTLPAFAKVCILPVKFKDLWRIRAPIGTCEGFDLSPMDAIVQKAIESADDFFESQPLWEYPGKAMGLVSHICLISEGNVAVSTNFECEIQCKEGEINGIALWVDYYQDSGEIWTKNGPEIRETNIKWPFGDKLGVHLLPKPIVCDRNSNLKLSVDYNGDTCEFSNWRLVFSES